MDLDDVMKNIRTLDGLVETDQLLSFKKMVDKDSENKTYQQLLDFELDDIAQKLNDKLGIEELILTQKLLAVVAQGLPSLKEFSILEMDEDIDSDDKKKIADIKDLLLLIPCLEKAFAKALKMKNIVLPSDGDGIGFNLGKLF